MKAFIPILLFGLFPFLVVGQPNTIPQQSTATFDDIRQGFKAQILGNSGTWDDHDSKFNRSAFLIEPRTFPSGKMINIPAKTLEAQIDYEAAMRDKNPNFKLGETTTGSWTQYGQPLGNKVGRVDKIAFHPTNSNIIYAGSAGGGLWKTTNGGSSWGSLTDALPLLGVTGIAIDHVNPNVIYMLTGESESAITIASAHTTVGSLGVLKSTDGGNSWFATGLSWLYSGGVVGYDLKIHPTNRNILIACTDNGIYRTTNGGSTWTQENTNTTYNLEFKPGDPTIVYAAGDNELYRSTDTGNSWTRIADSDFPASAARGAVAVSANSPGYVYIMFGSSSGTQGIFRSLNSGLSFDPKETADLTGNFGYWSTVLTADPLDQSTVITGGVNAFRSGSFANSGTFSQVFVNAHVDYHELIYQPGTNDLFAGTDGGIFKSSNDGTSWTDITNNMMITQYYRMTGSVTSPGTVVGGAQDNNSLKATSSGGTMIDVGDGDGMDTEIKRTNSNVVYVTSQYGRIYRSTNGGTVRSEITGSWPTGNSRPWITPLEQDKGNSTRYYFGTDDVYMYTESSGNWTSKNHPTANMRAMAQGTSNPNRFYTIATNNTIRRSDNFTSASPSWATKMSGLPSGVSWMEIECNPDNSLEVFVVASGYAAGTKVYKSTNGGDTWTDYSGSLPNVPVNVIRYHDNGLNNDALYIGNDLGVWYRNNSIGDWVPFTNYLPSAMVTDLYLSPQNGKIYASTYGRGIWSSDLFGACPNDLNFFNFLGIITGGTRYFQASDHIDSRSEYDGGIGTNINYEAGNYINLTPGFWIKSTSKFEGKIGPCHTNLTTPVANRPRGFYAGPLKGNVLKDEKVIGK